MKEKLWIYQDSGVEEKRDYVLVSSLIPKIYRCRLFNLDISNQSLTLDEFQKCTSSGSLETLSLNKAIVKNDDGSIVPIEKVIEHLPKLQTFYYENVPGNDGLQTITSETAANLIALPHFSKIKHISIKGIPESFDFEAFFAVPKVSSSMFT